MKALKSILKSVPGTVSLNEFLKKRYEPCGDFFTLSPSLLIALVKAFNIQRSQTTGGGRNLLDGHGYYEFGLFRGFSFWFAEQLSRDYAGEGLRHFGFDSFEGLPQPQIDIEAAAYEEGNFRGSYENVTANLRNAGTDFSRIKLYKGFYSDAFFGKLIETEKFPPISICVIDCDLYQSCVPVLEFIKGLLVEGSIILFDDYNQFGEDNSSGERLALLEFERRNPGWRKEHLFDYGWEGTVFRVTSV